MLDLVPLAGSRWKMTHRDFQMSSIRKWLKLEVDPENWTKKEGLFDGNGT
jgi:hypothetical protein